MTPAVYSRGVIARCGKCLVVMALVMTTGLHWAALQTVAWTAMLANNLCDRPITEAVSRTFDGEHMCPLCKAIAAGKKSEKKSETTLPALKMEFPMTGEKFVLTSPSPILAFSSGDCFAGARFLEPSLPPPRSLFV